MVGNNGLIKGALRVIGTLFAKRIETDEINGITKSEINCLDNVTSNVQTQLNGKATTAQGTKADNALPRSGGTMTGNIAYNMYSSTQTPVKVYGGNNNGQAISVGAGAATIVGSGESAKACESLLDPIKEELWLTSDEAINFYTNCNTIGNKVGVALGTGRQFYPDVNNTGSLGTSSNKWNNVYATTLTGSLSGNASSASKWATARTISFAGAATASMPIDGTANKTFTLLRRGASVGQSNDVVSDKPWYKFASVSISSSFADREIAFKVSSGYTLTAASGILKARIRTNGSSFYESAQLYWEYANLDIDLNKFVMVHNTGANPTVCELWCKCDLGHTGYHFAVVGENSRSDRNDTYWTLYNTWSAGSQSAPTSGYTQLASRFLTLKNPISGNASTTTKLVTPRTVTFTGDMTGSFSFDGSKNVTANLSYTKLPKVDKVLSGIVVAPSSFTNGIAKITNSYFTPYSVVDVYFDEASIPIAKKAGIVVNSENGYLELKAKKVPTGNLTLETIRIMDKEVTAALNGTRTLNGDITLEGYTHTPIVQNDARHE